MNSLDPVAENADSELPTRSWPRLLSRLLFRIGEALLSLLLLAALCFALLRSAPGGPFDSERSLSAEQQIALEQRYHLDQPLPAQFAHYLADFVRGDLGDSFQFPDYSVRALLLAGFSVTFWLGAWALLLATLIGTPLGVWSALRHRGAVDGLINGGAILGIALPKFVIAPLLILVFAVSLGWLPAGGWDAEDWRYSLLPIIALCLPNLAAITRLSRHAALEILASGYIRAARARGIEGAALLGRHLLKPLSLAVLAWLGPALIAVITGSTVVEQIFGIPGVGRYFVQGALNRDYTLVMGVALSAGVLIIISNLAIDAARAAIDPRLR